MEYIIVLSMLLGLAVGYLFSWYVSKEYEKIFSDVRPIRDVGREFIEQIAAIQNRFNIRLMLKKLVLAIFIVIMPLVAQYESTYEVMIVYPIAWMYFGLQCFYNKKEYRNEQSI